LEESELSAIDQGVDISTGERGCPLVSTTYYLHFFGVSKIIPVTGALNHMHLVDEGLLLCLIPIVFFPFSDMTENALSEDWIV
jgi:hypothetical protein